MGVIATGGLGAEVAHGLLRLAPIGERGAELDLLLQRRGRRWGFEFKCTDASRTTKSMHIVADDLGLSHLWVIYPGELEYPMTRRITALPLAKVAEIEFGATPSGASRP